MPPDFIFTLPHGGMLLVILAAVGSIALALHVFIARWPLKAISQRLPELSPAIITLCGTLFGLSVTFLANSVWTAEDRARQMVNSEARDIRVIRVYMDSFTGPTRDGFNHLITAYANAVAAEWNDMTNANARAPAERELRNIYAAAISGFSEGEQNRMIQQRLLSALDSLSIARQQRLSMAQDVVSAGQWLLVSGLGLLLLVMVALGHARFPLPRGVAMAAMTAAITLALFVIVVHDRPFIGYSALSPQPILRAAGIGS
jgi:hypothetical protein